MRFVWIVLLCALCRLAFAETLAQDPAAHLATEARVMHIANELRCLVCQNQSIADSHADLAIDLRREIREQIAAGRSDDEIKGFMAERYGDFVLYKPPFEPTTWLLWFAPALLFLAGAWLLVRHLRGRREGDEGPALSDEERAKAAALLQGESE